MHLNKKSLKQQGGQMIPQQPAMQNQQQVDPMVQQVTEMISTSVNEGQDIIDVVISLTQQEVDQQVIGQALMMGGMEEQDIISLFEQASKKMQPQPATAREVNANPQELARNQELAQQQQGPVAVDPIDMAKSGIEIKPENKGKFTRWAKSRGMSVSEAANTVMGNTDSYPPSVVKMANFAKNAAGWKKEEGGEFKPHFMYKGERKIRAKDMATHLRLKDAGYNHKAQEGVEVPEDGVETLTDEQKKANAQRTAFLNASKVDSINGVNFNNNINKNDEGIISGTNYFNPNAFKTGNNFSLGKAANVVSEGLSNLFSGEDKDGDGVKDGSFRDWSGKAERNAAQKLADTTYDVKLDFSQKNKDAYAAYKTQYDIENPATDALGNAVEQEEVDASGNIVMKEQPVDAFTSWLNNTATDLKGKGLETFNALKNMVTSKRVIDNTGEEEVITVQEYGSELPKAQFLGEFPSNDSGYGFDPYNDDLGEFMENAGQTNYVQDTNRIIPKGKREMEVSTGPVQIDQPSADELFKEIQGPEFTANTGGLSGFLDRAKDNIPATIFGDLSDIAVKGADVVNDWYDDKNIIDAKNDMRSNLVADNIYGTKTDAFNKRGTTDVNSGLIGSEGDRTTGLYMSKQGGGINNAGFKALPDFVQHNILSNMAGGGEAAYLANRDRVIKREMAKAQFGNGETEGMRQREGSYNPANRKYTLDPRFRKQGGETVNVTSEMLAKLIAAGADIEML
tara:strand:+ start:9596 stop:11806 length:2211 start_codon:yes stop_codon:yes gene_type:complete